MLVDSILAGAKSGSGSVPLNDADYLELVTKSSAAGLSLPASVRKCCGMSPWIVRGREMESRPREPVWRPSLALERISVVVVLTGGEYGDMLSRSRRAGTTVRQYVRLQCGFEVRNTSLPNTPEREREEDDAWEQLQRLGLVPQPFFPFRE